MKKLLKILTLLSGAALLIYLVMAWDSFMDFRNMRAETSAFALQTADIIITGNNEKFKEYADPSLIYIFSDPDHCLDVYSKFVRAMGKPTTPTNCLLVDTDISSNHSLATYQCSAGYENGPINVDIKLQHTKGDSAWKIFAFRINSPYFMHLMHR